MQPNNTISHFGVCNNIEEPDLIPPNIVIYEPVGYQTVSGTIEISTIATDNDSIDRVEFYHNYNLEYIDTIPFYTYTWNTLDEDEDTEHIWYALAYDISGNISQTDPITITVDNIDNELLVGYYISLCWPSSI